MEGSERPGAITDDEGNTVWDRKYTRFASDNEREPFGTASNQLDPPEVQPTSGSTNPRSKLEATPLEPAATPEVNQRHLDATRDLVGKDKPGKGPSLMESGQPLQARPRQRSGQSREAEEREQTGGST